MLFMVYFKPGNKTRLFSRTEAVPHPPRECPESDRITATFTHSQPAFEVAHLAAGGKGIAF